MPPPAASPDDQSADDSDHDSADGRAAEDAAFAAALAACGCQHLRSPAGYAAPAPTAAARANGPHRVSVWSVGHYHPQPHTRVQVLGSAATAALAAALPPWPGAQPDLVIVADGADATPWLPLASDSTIYRCAAPAERVLDQLRRHLAEQHSPHCIVHGTAVEVLGLGLLITGDSGAGKSELALELIARGHRLIADDAVALRQPAPGCLLATSPPMLKGFLEVRGLGILDIAAAYGADAVAARARLDLVIRLDAGASAAGDADERLHGRRGSLHLCRDGIDQQLPEIVLPTRLAHSAVMAEAACRDHWLRCDGYFASQAIATAQTRAVAARSEDADDRRGIAPAAHADREPERRR